MNDIIHSYSRADAIRDGVLIDVSQLAREAGFRYPVAITELVWNGYIQPPADTPGQDVTGRLWDVLSVLRFHIRSFPADTDRIEFQVLFCMRPVRTTAIELVSICGPGDNLEPVITIMGPDES